MIATRLALFTLFLSNRRLPGSSLSGVRAMATALHEAALDTQRKVTKVTVARRQREGGGFIVRRPLGGEVDHIGGVFLMLDHMGPVDYKPGEAIGAPDHPHRGFSTVSYLLEGSMDHKDSAGHSGRLGPGWVQWMDAGRGVVHSETPSSEVMERGGRVEGFQLWVNLPAHDKMCPPAYQDVPPEKVPIVKIPGAVHADTSVRVIAGECGGVQGAVRTRTPVTYLDVHLGPSDALVQPVPHGHVAFAYVYCGHGKFGALRHDASESAMIQIDTVGDAFRMEGSDPSGVRVLFFSGAPIPDPISRYGPFVMNTREQIMQAFEDYRSGRMGAIDGAEERYAATEAAKRTQQASGSWTRSEL